MSKFKVLDAKLYVFGTKSLGFWTQNLCFWDFVLMAKFKFFTVSGNEKVSEGFQRGFNKKSENLFLQSGFRVVLDGSTCCY